MINLNLYAPSLGMALLLNGFQFFKMWAKSGLSFCLFSSFLNTLTNKTINAKSIDVCMGFEPRTPLSLGGPQFKVNLLYISPDLIRLFAKTKDAFSHTISSRDFM